MSINKVILIGNLGNDPEKRDTPSGVSVANFNIATSKKIKGEQKTEWHRIVAWDKLADNCAQYLHKGSKVYIEGELQTREWKDEQGVTKYMTEIIARDVQFLDPRESNGNGNSQPATGRMF